MIQVIMGLKGSGKTKKLVDSINIAVAGAQGDVVCIEYGKKLTYDVSHRVRLVDSKEYGITNLDMLKGFISGLHAGNFDITNVYIDPFFMSLTHSHGAYSNCLYYSFSQFIPVLSHFLQLSLLL